MLSVAVRNSWQKKAALALLVVVAAVAGTGVTWGLDAVTVGTVTPPAKTVEAALEHVFKARAAALLRGEADSVTGFYDTSSLYGRWALEHETRRVKYVSVWAKARGVKLKDVHSAIGIRTIDSGENKAWVFLVQTLNVAYAYTNEPNEPINRFGVGTRHTVEMVYKDGNWLIRRDWFTDPLEEDALVSDVAPAPTPEPETAQPAPDGQKPKSFALPQSPAGSRFDRKGAVAYANKYAGLALSTDHRYNPAYRDYTNVGGDCTNFISQVLADQEGGKLPTDWTWRYSQSKTGLGSGSAAWVQASSLANYLLYNGHARLVARGTFSDLVRATTQHPFGAIRELEEGDVIAYEEKGRIEHLAVIVGRDSRGYLLVNSHTADRYRVPWDLGWDKKTVFWLLRIID